MLVINYNGKKPNQKEYNYAVVGNSNANVIRFVLQSSICSIYTLEEISNFDFYAKMRSAGSEYIDKVMGEVSFENDLIIFDVLITKKMTHWKNLSLQVQIEANGGLIVAQTEIVCLELSSTISADKEISEEYPEAIQQLEGKVNTFDRRITDVEEKVVEAKEIIIGNPNDYLNENGLDKIIRVEDENGNVEKSYFIDKIHHKSTLVEAVANTESDVDGEPAYDEYKAREIGGQSASGSMVELSSNKGQTYSQPITLERFIENCESDLYNGQAGLMARISDLINGKTMRLILIGTNHDVLSNTDLGESEPNGEKTKTTWQFYDMPIRSCQLGLPFEEERTGNVRSSQDSETPIEDCVEITISTEAPSNMHGYQTAVGLRQAEQDIYNSLPTVLQQHIKTVRKDIFISEISNNGWNYENFDSTGTVITYDNDRYGCYVMTKLFSLSASEIGIIPNPQEEFNAFPYKIPNSEGDDVMLEGTKYEYFNETYPFTSEPEEDRRRPRYYNNELWYYWLRSPFLLGSDYWGICVNDGSVYNDSTSYYFGVAPAFCI